jgi:hypothetical protein
MFPDNDDVNCRKQSARRKKLSPWSIYLPTMLCCCCSLNFKVHFLLYILLINWKKAIDNSFYYRES